MDQLEQLTAALRRDCPAVELREWEPMARHTTFRIGGPVRLMALPKTAEEAEQVLRLAAEREIQPFFLGNGSNLLVADEGYHGFALKLAGELDRIHMREGRLSAGGAVLLSRLAGAALSRGLSGLEFAHGIPGSLGGAVTMNAGAYGGEMVQVVASVTCLSRRGEVETVPAERCAFSYRHSAFSDGGRLILKVEFCLRPGDPAADGGSDRRSGGKAASGVPQRRVHVQTAKGPLRRRPYRAVRIEGPHRGRCPSV